jgi:hypothetical protein
LPRRHYDLAQRASGARPLFAVTTDLTIASGTTTTAVRDQILGADTAALFTALNAAAAGIHASIYVSARDKGSLTLTHSAPGSDAAFALLLIG